MDATKLFIRIDLLVTYFKLNINNILNIINTTYILKSNSNIFKYRDTYYINIEAIIYIIITNNLNEDINKFFIKQKKHNIKDYDSYVIIINKLTNDIKKSNKYNNVKNSILLFNESKEIGYVYLAKTDNFIKIGMTGNPASRQQSIKQDAIKNNIIEPFAIITLLYTKDVFSARAKEAELHRVFKEYRYKGEWFNNPIEIDNAVNKEYSKYILI